MSGATFDPLLGQLRTSDGSSSPLTTKGDIYTYSTTNARLPVGTDGTVLSADSGQTTGLKWIAAGGTGTVTSVSVATANGVSGTVANPTTTPAITLTLGAITPSSVNSVVLSGSSTPTLAVTGTSSISGSNTGDQTITLTGDVTGSGTGSFATTIKSSVGLAGSPTTTTQSSTDNSTKIATTAYVTTGIANAISGVNPAVAVQAATTSASNTSGFTYNNGASGVGATLTQNSAAVYVVDGFTFSSTTQRLLVKNDTQTTGGASAGAFNGIYLCTTVGTSLIPAVFTRALDYNTPSDINNTGAIPVVNGTVNALTSWLLTSQVTTVGTNALTYSQFSYSPTSVIPPNLGGTGVANNASSTLTISGSFGTTFTVSNTTSLTLPTSGTVTALGNSTTGSGNIVLASSPSLTTPSLGTATATGLIITSTSGSALAVGANGSTNPALQVNDSGSTPVNGISIVANAAGTSPHVSTISSQTNEGLRIDAKGSGVINFASTSTGAVQVNGDTIGTLTATQAFTNKDLTSATNTFPASIATNIPWTVVTGTSQAAAVNNGYFTNNAGLVTVTLPSTAAVGSIVEVAGLGAGGWKVGQAASVLIHFGSSVTTTGTGGSLASVNQYDAVRLVCSVANTTWHVLSSVGNVTVV